MSIFRRKGKKVEYNEGTQEDVGTSSESRRYFEGEGNKFTDESEKEHMDRIEKENPDAKAYRREHEQPRPERGSISSNGNEFTVEKTPPAKGSEEYMEQFRAKRKVEKEQSRQEELLNIRNKTETTQAKKELAQQHRAEVEAGGGGIGGFVKRTVSGTKQKTTEEVKESKRQRKSKKGEYERKQTSNRGYRTRTSPMRMSPIGVGGVRGAHPSTGMRQLVMPGAPVTGRSGTPMPSGGVSSMRDLTIPRANPALQAAMKPSMKPSLRPAPRPSFKMQKGIGLEIGRAHV